MSARVEAALEAFRRERVWQEEETPMRAALAAADAVMFSDEAVERVGRAVDDFTMHEYGHAIPESDRNGLISVVIGALMSDVGTGVNPGPFLDPFSSEFRDRVEGALSLSSKGDEA